jgi:hypothetical protein
VHAHHLERHAEDLDALADRIEAREERFGQLVVDDHDVARRGILPSYPTGPSVCSVRLMSRTAGSARMSSASSTVISGMRRHGDSSSEPSEMSSPPEK